MPEKKPPTFNERVTLGVGMPNGRVFFISKRIAFVELRRDHVRKTMTWSPGLSARIMEPLHRLSGNNGVAPTGSSLKIMGCLMRL